MSRDLERYKEILVEDMSMFIGVTHSEVITQQEYSDYNKVGAAIEEILEAKYGEDVVNKVRWGTI